MYNVYEGWKYAKPGFRNGYRTTVRELTGKQSPRNYKHYRQETGGIEHEELQCIQNH